MDAIRFGLGSSNFFNLPYWIAEERAFFTDEGLDVEPVVFYGTPEEDSMLRDRRVHLGLHATEAIFASIDQGAPLTIVAGNLRRSPFTFVGAPHVKDPGQLHGGTVGVSDLEAGTSTLLRRYLRSFGLEYQADYTMRAVGMIPVRWELLQSGEIQAGLQGAPLDYIALDRGFTDLGDVTQGFPTFEFCSIAANAQWARGNRGLLVRALRAYSRAHHWFYQNREAASAIAARRMGIDPGYAARAWDNYTAREIFPPDGDTDLAGLRSMWEISHEVRGRDTAEAFDEGRYVDRSYFEEAVSTPAWR